MGRPCNPLCLNCPSLTVEQAKQQACWQDDLCHSRRSHYRHRVKRNLQRQQLNKPIETLAGDSSYRFILYSYEEGRGAGESTQRPVIAVRASVYKGNCLIAEIPPIITAGFTNKQMTATLRSMLKTLGKVAQTSSEPEVFQAKVTIAARLLEEDTLKFSQRLTFQT